MCVYDEQQYVVQIDVVTERSLRRFLNLLDQEFEEIYRRMYLQSEKLIDAVKAEKRRRSSEAEGSDDHS